MYLFQLCCDYGPIRAKESYRIRITITSSFKDLFIDLNDREDSIVEVHKQSIAFIETIIPSFELYETLQGKIQEDMSDIGLVGDGDSPMSCSAALPLGSKLLGPEAMAECAGFRCYMP